MEIVCHLKPTRGSVPWKAITLRLYGAQPLGYRDSLLFIYLLPRNSLIPTAQFRLFAGSGVDGVATCGCRWQQILSQMEAVAEKKAPKQPRFVQPLQNAEITEGQR